MSIIRKHRLWEVFLVDKLNYKWNEVHNLAEQLEHIESDDLIKRLEVFLGHPTVDPHGDPIPDENGNISSTPPDPNKRKVFKQEDMQIGVPKHIPGEDENSVRTGVVAFFNDEKGFGFINDLQTQERVFVHANNLSEPLKEGNRVNFEVEMGPKGPSAVNVKKA